MTGRKRPGPEKRVDKATLIRAGIRAVRQRFTTPQRLEELLGVRLREVTVAADAEYLAQHGERPNPPISSSAIYRQWDDKESFLQEVFQSMFAMPEDAVLTSALDQDDRSWQASLADWLDADQAQAGDLGPVFLLAFLPAAAGDPVARDALRGVYDGFDEVIRPLLRSFLAQHNLKVTLPYDAEDEDGTARLARMLTVITEGWYLRSIAQPEVRQQRTGGLSPWASQAILTIESATEHRPIAAV